MAMKFRTFCSIFTAASLTLLTGCLEQGVVLNKPAGMPATSRFSGDPSRLNRIELRVTQFTQLAEGETAQLAVFAFDDQGNQIDPALLSLEWKAADGTAIQIDQNGLVKGLLPFSSSEVTVTDTKTQISDSGQISVTGQYTGDPALLDRLLFAYANQSLVNQGDQIAFHLIALDTQGRPIDPSKLGTINWAVSDTLHYSINGNGVVTALSGAGSSNAAALARVTATHSASGKVANGTVDMVHGGNNGTPSSPSSPEPGSSVSPSTAPSPSAVSSPVPTASPTLIPSPQPSPSSSANPLFPGDATKLARLSVSPSVGYLHEKGQIVSFFVQAYDTQDQLIDPSKLELVWSTNKAALFKVTGAGRDCTVEALDTSGYADLIVTNPATGIKGMAEIRMSSGGGGGGGSPTVSRGVLTEPVIDEMLFSYAGSSNGRLYAFDNNQDETWSFRADGAIRQNPAATIDYETGDGRLFFGTQNGTVYGVNFRVGADNGGTTSWARTRNSAITTAPVVYDDAPLGKVFVGNAAGDIYGYTFDGDPLNSGAAADISDEPLLSSPVLFRRNNTLYAATQEGELCAVNPDTLSENECEPAYAPNESPAGAFVADLAMYDDNTIVVGNEDGNLYFFETDGQGVYQRRAYDLDEGSDEPIRNPVAIDSNDVIYVPVGGSLYALEEGEGINDIWEGARQICPGSSTIVGAPLVLNNDLNFVYVNCSNGRLYQVNASGITLNDADPGEVINSFPIAGGGSNLIAGPTVTLEEEQQQPTALVDGENHIFVGGANGEMQIFDLEGEFNDGLELDLDGAGYGRFEDKPFHWPIFRFDPNNSGVYNPGCYDCLQ